MSWTHALRQIVINCYKYHGREDLLPAFTDDDEKQPQGAVSKYYYYFTLLPNITLLPLFGLDLILIGLHYSKIDIKKK